MKSLQEIRLCHDLQPIECSSQIKYFKGLDIDWNVYLPSRKRNLQRDFVWTLEQKRELIWSVLIGRHIAHCAVINTVNKDDYNKDVWLIIDGKQRLSTIFDFIDGKFTIEIEGSEFYFGELPDDYQIAIKFHHFRYYVVHEDWGNPITDEQKIAWFKFINFAGTPQEITHLNSL